MNWGFYLEPPIPVLRRPRGRQGTTAHHTHPQTKADQKRIRDHFFKLYGSPRTQAKVQLTVQVFPENYKYPDLNNVVGCIQDALNKVCWEDDQQVKRLHDCQMHDYEPGQRHGLTVTITEL